MFIFVRGGSRSGSLIGIGFEVNPVTTKGVWSNVLFKHVSNGTPSRFDWTTDTFLSPCDKFIAIMY